jgi:phosphatidylglycerophosphate synthase/antitoxin (DNA-binding transcriptional repressor) of toxin-antitoxin stability system
MTGSPPHAAPAAWILTPAGASTLEIWGLTPAERLRRSLARADAAPIRTLGAGEAIETTGPTLLARGDWIYDERLIEALVRAPNTVLVTPAAGGVPVAAFVPADRADETLAALRAGEPTAPAGLRAVGPDELAPAYTAKLRKAEPPYLLPARPELAREIEGRTFSASYKGATDLVTKWVWPLPARAATRRLAAANVHPNTVTIASWVLAVAVFWLFARGNFGVGLAAAWLMTFLDTVDGKLARVTLTSSRLGDVLDHGLDLVHPPFWWWAWGVGLGWAFAPATLVVVGGYFAGRALEGIFLLAFGMETHCWRPIDTLFRTITARRNPNLILFSVGFLAGRPDLGMIMVALWTLASLAFHAVRLLQAFAARSRGQQIEPWDEGLKLAFRSIEETARQERPEEDGE